MASGNKTQRVPTAQKYQLTEGVTGSAVRLTVKIGVKCVSNKFNSYPGFQSCHACTHRSLQKDSNGTSVSLTLGASTHDAFASAMADEAV